MIEGCEGYVCITLPGTAEKITQQQILEWWPKDSASPDRTTLGRWLKRATEQGLICCEGARADPFRYWLPGREPLLKPDDGASEAKIEAWKQRWRAHMCEELLGKG
jgi:hypothetical protein